MKIIVLAGGLSPERDVSLSSGSLITNALIDLGHEVGLIDLYVGVEEMNLDEVLIKSASEKRYAYFVPETEPNLDQLREDNNGKLLIGKNVLDLCKQADLVFMALHGSIGENGMLQAVFDTLGIAYTGSGYIGSLLAMDKDLAKSLMVRNNIPTPLWELIDINSNSQKIPESIIGFPCVVKPNSCGSSIGVSFVRNRNEYISAIKHAGKYGTGIIVEEMIEGRNFSVGVLENKALPVIEMIPEKGFYDYRNKYQVGATQEICPAEIPADVAAEMQHVALKVHEVLRLSSYSRIDFILDKQKKIFCLEANTLPGMTPTSLLPLEAETVGISFSELCNKIITMAL